MPSESKKYLDLIMHYYAWLVEEYGFALIDASDVYMGSCSFTLQSGDCRLFITVERGLLGAAYVALAPVAAQLDASAPGLQWYHIADVLDYLRGWYPSWSQIDERGRMLLSLSTEGRYTREATEWRALWPQIMALFREDEFKKRQPELEAFIRNMYEDLNKQRKESVT